MIVTFLILVFFHYLADYPLQGDYMARAKNKYNPIEGVPWYQAMGAHCFIHGMFVFLITGSFLLLILEMIVHWMTDTLKCKGVINYNVDQGIHIASKFVYAWLSIPVIETTTQVVSHMV